MCENGKTDMKISSLGGWSVSPFSTATDICKALETRLWWVRRTPFGRPVVPLEYGSAARAVFESILGGLKDDTRDSANKDSKDTGSAEVEPLSMMKMLSWEIPLVLAADSAVSSNAVCVIKALAPLFCN